MLRSFLRLTASTIHTRLHTHLLAFVTMSTKRSSRSLSSATAAAPVAAKKSTKKAASTTTVEKKATPAKRKAPSTTEAIEEVVTTMDMSETKKSSKKKSSAASSKKAKKAVVEDDVEMVDAAATTTVAAIQTVEPASKRVKKSAASTKKKTVASKSPKKKTTASSTSSATDSVDEWKFGTVSREMETTLQAEGKAVILGIDEAGRGPLAGPVVAAGVYLPPHVHFEGVNDSKILTEPQRESLFALLTNHPDVVYSVCILDHEVIDRINILEATLLAMQTCVDDIAKKLQSRPKPVKVDYVLVDGNRLPKTLTHPSEAVVKGDGRVYSIAAASIIAKVTRDRIMLKYHEQYPQYNFAQHKGYGVGAHMSAIHRYGPCPIHRMTFAPMKHMKGGKVKKEEENFEPPKKRTTKNSSK